MFFSPWYFLLLLLLPLIAWRLFAPRRRSAVRFSSVNLAKQLTPTLRQRLIWLPRALTISAVLAMIVGLAQPREGREQTVTDSEGIAIEMVVDRSGSMQALDFQVDGEHVDRLTAIKNVAGKFVVGGDKLEGRFSDLVGLIAFAGYADGETPPTLTMRFWFRNSTTLRLSRTATRTELQSETPFRSPSRNSMPWMRGRKKRSGAKSLFC